MVPKSQMGETFSLFLLNDTVYFLKWNNSKLLVEVVAKNVLLVIDFLKMSDELTSPKCFSIINNLVLLNYLLRCILAERV